MKTLLLTSAAFAAPLEVDVDIDTHLVRGGVAYHF